MGLKIISKLEVAKELLVAEGTVCDTIGEEDKKELCKHVLEEHSEMKINTKEAEKQISEITGEEVVMVEEPDWKMLPQDPEVLESWATSVCLSYGEENSDEKKVQACVDIIDKIVKNETDLETASKKIGKIMREDPDEIAKTLIITAPGQTS